MSGESDREPDVEDAEEPQVDGDERPDADRARDDDRPFEWVEEDDVERPEYGPIVSASQRSSENRDQESTADADGSSADGGDERSEDDDSVADEGEPTAADGRGDGDAEPTRASDADDESAERDEGEADADDESAERDEGEADADDVEDDAGTADEDGDAGTEDDEGEDDPSADEDGEDEASGDDAGEPDEYADEPVADDEIADAPRAETDGEGYVRDRQDDDPEYPDPDDDVGGISTPPDDEEMPLADHIEEMMLRLAAVLLFAGAGTAVGILGASWAIEFIWADVIPNSLERPPHVYHPLELWMTRIKVAALVGVLIGLPMFVYQCYLFMRPGLYPNERKYYLSSVPMSLVLAAVGMFFSYQIVLPILFRYFTYYSEESAQIQYALGDTFDLVITLTAFLAIVFQIPLFIMLAIMMGVTTRKWLADKRLYFWAAFLGLSFMFTLDPTGMAPIIVAIVMILLFEGTLFLLKWVGRE